jgi:hypothetical protein
MHASVSNATEESLPITLQCLNISNPTKSVPDAKLLRFQNHQVRLSYTNQLTDKKW